MHISLWNYNNPVDLIARAATIKLEGLKNNKNSNVMQIKTENQQIKQYLELFGVFLDPIIGIDLGSSAVKIMELTQKNNRYCVKNFAVEHLQTGDIVEKNIRNKDAVTKALLKALNKSKITSRLGCISIPSSSSISKIIQLEVGLTEKEIANEISLEADRYIPYELDEVNLDSNSLTFQSNCS